jgi:hypothetical protein
MCRFRFPKFFKPQFPILIFFYIFLLSFETCPSTTQFPYFFVPRPITSASVLRSKIALTHLPTFATPHHRHHLTSLSRQSPSRAHIAQRVYEEQSRKIAYLPWVILISYGTLEQMTTKKNNAAQCTALHPRALLYFFAAKYWREYDSDVG